ncbi:hypothetical protein DPMN_026606 [Dreissena polymorpha]|uniref:Uncharacterized protein n=1 Tax=Dreissena polymorpha TaxID=45954 RepID=A0A9D4LRZ2_DREPO|nr:hypothetical protein DPMN_026606 [Dreissena polymorpha]
MLSKDGTSTAEVRIRIGDRSDIHTELAVNKQFNKFPHQVQILQVRCSLLPPLRLYIRISYTEQKTNYYVRNISATRVGPNEPLLATVNRRKFAWFGHVAKRFSGHARGRSKLRF